MICESCRNREATVHLTQVIDGNVKKLHLCEECADESGFDIQGPMSITDVLLGLGEDDASPDSDQGRDDVRKHCGICGLTLPQFRSKGRLGCPDCYASFEAEIIPLLDSMHHSTRHVGKVPAAAGRPESGSGEIPALQSMLDEAVESENFEEAAVLRDKIAAIRATSESIGG